MAADLGTLLDSSYLGDLAERSIGDVRAMRAECQEVESGMSLLRRLVQGRLDIVGLELRRRASGAVPEDASDLIAHLPEVLAARTHAPGVRSEERRVGKGGVRPCGPRWWPYQ